MQVDKQERDVCGTQELERVVRHRGRRFLDTYGAVRLTGVNLTPEWKDGFDYARHERTLFAVACSRLFGKVPASCANRAKGSFTLVRK